MARSQDDGGFCKYIIAMSLVIYERREYRQNGFAYLLDDEEKTAWIKQGRIKRCRCYRLPDHVMVDGVRYTIVGVEAGAYNHPRTLHHLVIPDIIHDFDEYCSDGFKNLESIHLGKGWDYLDGWYFINCPKLRTIHIDKFNPYLKVHDGMVLSKDGKKVYLGFSNRKHLTIHDGVEEIGQYAFWHHKKLETIQFPKTLRKIGDNSFSNCPKLRSVVLPEGFRECVVQSFIENENLNLIDFPATFLKLGYQTMVVCPNLQTIVLRAPQVVETSDGHPYGGIPTDTCRLYVHAELVEQYKEHPVWREFQHIFAIEKYANYEIPFQTLSNHDDVFDLNKIPMEVLDKGWKRYRPFLLIGDEQHPLQFGRPVGGDTPFFVLQNIRTMITHTFEIDEKQFVITEDKGDPLISILIALCDDNVAGMEAAMQTQWYFKEDSPCNRLLEDLKGRRWMNVRFKIKDRPRHQSAWDHLCEIENNVGK